LATHQYPATPLLGLLMAPGIDTVEIMDSSGRPDQSLKRMAVEIFRGHHPGRMGAIDSEREKKTVAIRLQGINPLAHRNLSGHSMGRHSGNAPPAGGIDVPIGIGDGI
jgi:hypothetical protein